MKEEINTSVLILQEQFSTLEDIRNSPIRALEYVVHERRVAWAQLEVAN